MCKMYRLVFFLGVATLLWSSPMRTRAQGADAPQQRFKALSKSQRELLAPHLSAGPVLLVDFARKPALHGLHLVMHVNASADRTFHMVADPKNHRRLLPLLQKVSVKDRKGLSQGYSWSGRMALMNLQGTASVVALRSPKPSRAHRIDMRHLTGDLGEGRTLWRIYPTSKGTCTVVISSRIDLRDANYITRTLGRGKRGMNRSMNITLLVMMGLEAKRHVETNTVMHTESHPELTVAHTTALMPLLVRGDLLFLRLHHDQLERLETLAYQGTDRNRVEKVLHDPMEFMPYLMPGAYAKTLTSTAEQTTFKWGMSMPLIGTSGVMRLLDRGPGVVVQALSGALEGGWWRFEPHCINGGITVLHANARFDPTKVSWLLQAIVGNSAPLKYGIAAGSHIMAVRAVRSRVHRMHERRRQNQR